MSYQMGDAPMGAYQTAQPTQAAQQRYPQLNQILRSQDGFERSIKYAGGADAAIGIVLTAALIALAYNVFSVFRSFAPNGLPVTLENFWMLFTSTTNENGDFSVMLWLMTYVPLIAIPLLVVLLVVKKVTAHGSVAKAFDKFNQGGFLTDLVPTGVMTQIGNNKMQFFVAGDPTIPSDWLTSAAQRIAARATTDPKAKETKEYIKALTKGVGVGGSLVPAAKCDPSLPAGMYLMAQMGAGDGRPQIAIPQKPDRARFNLYALKKETPIA